MKSWLRQAVHAAFVGGVVLLLAVAYAFGRLGTLFVDEARRAQAVGRLRGRLLRRGMTWLGATFIKMGQVMSTRPDLFSPEVIDELRHLQDRLPPFSFVEARRALEASLGRPIDAVFAELDEAPVAAASVAQVHRGRLQGGDEVAVKILRPNVRRQVERDAALLLFGARFLALFERARLSDPVGHTRHFVQGIIDQTDLRVEAANYERFRTNFAGVAAVSFPRVRAELSGERVLVMEFVRGRKIDGPLTPDEKRLVSKATREAIFKMCFEDGFLHCDLHPGNMLLADDGVLVLFDVGLAKLLGEEVLIQFIDLTKCLTMGTPDDVITHLKRFHHYIGEVDWEALRADVDAMARRFRGQEIARLEYGELINEMLALGRKYQVRPITDMALVFVAMVTAQGIGKQLNPDANVFAEIAAYLLPILARRGEAIPATEEARAARR
jgi:ubiquinone biosynthesis protein